MTNPPTPPAGSVRQVWLLMQRFVEGQNRRAELAEALGFRLGGGRGKLLTQLRDGPLTLGQLAEGGGFDAPYTTVIVDKLEALGLVERRPHPQDRRRKLVGLTTAGHDALATTDAILQRPPAALEALTRAELDHLGALLTRLDQSDPARATSR